MFITVANALSIPIITALITNPREYNTANSLAKKPILSYSLVISNYNKKGVI